MAELSALDKRMITIYTKLVKAGSKTLDEVPAKIREEVKKALEGDN